MSTSAEVKMVVIAQGVHVHYFWSEKPYHEDEPGQVWVVRISGASIYGEAIPRGGDYTPMFECGLNAMKYTHLPFAEAKMPCYAERDPGSDAQQPLVVPVLTNAADQQA